MRKKLGNIVVLLCLCIGYVSAQDAQFSQFFSNKLYLNPSYAGNPEQIEMFTGFKNQWPGFENAFNTYSFSYNQYVKPLKGGLGLSLINDMQSGFGVYNISLSGIYSYHIKIDRDNYARLGLKAGVVSNAFLPGSFDFPSMVDPTRNSQVVQIPGQMSTAADFSVGGLYIHRNWHFGFSVDHIYNVHLPFNTSVLTLPMKFTFHAVGSFDYNPYRLIKPEFVFYPVLLIQKQSDNLQLNYGTYLEKGDVTFGAWLKQNLTFDYYSATFLLGIKIKKYNIAYSYDVYFMNKQRAGLLTSAHEVTFLYKFGYKERVPKIRAIKCPEF